MTMAIVGAFMVPHPPIIMNEVGHGEEKKIQRTIDSYTECAKKIAELAPDLIIVATPHTVMYSDYFSVSPGKVASGDMGSFRAPQVSFQVSYDEEFTTELDRMCRKRNFAAGTMGERPKYRRLDHGTMIPLYFINRFYSPERYKLVRIGLSGQSYEKHYELGMMLKELSERLDRRAVFIASGDLSHCQREDGPYGYKKVGPEYDERLISCMKKADFASLFDFDYDFIEEAEQCGHRSFVMMAGALDRTRVEATYLSHEATFGVGYGICYYIPEGQDESRAFLDTYIEKKKLAMEKRIGAEDGFVKLARFTVESFIGRGVVPHIEGGYAVAEKERLKLDRELLSRRAGAFTTLKKDGMLRGCIGTIAPTENTLAEEIIHNAVSASSRDPRFSKVRYDELPSLTYSVDVLNPPQEVDSVDDLDPRVYGVIVSKGHRRGLLLPDLSGVDTVERQLEIAAEKGGIRMSEDPVIERFTVTRHF